MNERQVAISQLVVSREAWPRFNLDEERTARFW